MILLSNPPLILYQDPCRTQSYNLVKLELVRNFFGLDLDVGMLPDLVDYFREWRDEVELLPLRLTHAAVNTLDLSNTPVKNQAWIDFYESLNPGFHAFNFNDNPNCRLVCYEGKKVTWLNKKSVKRGNDVYVDMLRKKFKPLFASSNHKVFFSTVLNEKRKRVRRSRLLYLTGTCDSKCTGGISESWSTFGQNWNRFVTSLRDVFGKTAYIRTWQSQKNGMPHFHTLMYFYDFEFTVMPWTEEDGSVSWRVHNRQKVVVNKKSGAKEYCRDVIKDRWKWGHLEVECCDDTKKALTDLLKYCLRDLEGGESDVTNALVWFFRKKSFAVSKGFEELFGAFSEPENADWINAEGVIQEATQEDRLLSIDVFPLIPKKILPQYRQMLIDFEGIAPDPPPEVVDFLEDFASRCVPSSSRVTADGVLINVYKLRDSY